MRAWSWEHGQRLQTPWNGAVMVLIGWSWRQKYQQLLRTGRLANCWVFPRSSEPESWGWGWATYAWWSFRWVPMLPAACRPTALCSHWESVDTGVTWGVSGDSRTNLGRRTQQSYSLFRTHPRVIIDIRISRTVTWPSTTGFNLHIFFNWFSSSHILGLNKGTLA